MISKDNNYLSEASQAIYEFNADEITRQKCWAREDYYRTQNTYKKLISDLQNQVNDFQQTIAENEATIAQNKAALAEKDNALAENKAAITEKNNAIAQKDMQISQFLDEITELKKLLANSQSSIQIIWYLN